MFCQKNLIIIGKKAREGITHDSVVRTGLSEEATLNKVEPKCKTALSGQVADVAQLGPQGCRGRSAAGLHLRKAGGSRH